MFICRPNIILSRDYDAVFLEHKAFNATSALDCPVGKRFKKKLLIISKNSLITEKVI